MNETGSELRGWTRRNFLKAAGIAGCAMLFPWLAYAAESDELNAKADELAASAASKQAEADEMKAKLDSLQAQYNEALERYNTANDAHEAAVAAMDAAQQRIDEAQSLIESTRNQLAKRANSIYREGSMSMIDVIFGSQSFDDFVTNWDSVERISQQDAALVQQNKDAKAEAEAAHAEYSKQEKVAAEDLANAKAAKEELETAQAALQIACDLVDEGMISEQEAVAMIEPRTLDTLLHPQFDAAAAKKAEVIGKALGASPGAASGKIVFTAEDAKAEAAKGEKVVLVRLETSPEDIEGMKAAQGILTVRGGMTSHAAVVARGMGKCCVSGCSAITMDEANKCFTLSGKTYHEGDWISFDGSNGNVYDGVIPTVDASISGEFGRIMGWADKYRKLSVRTNADTPHDAKKARELGAEGIGLCRTEHMFFESDRIEAIREMICSDTVQERETALAKLLPMQQSDFEGIYEAMEGYPVTIRFLDPPLHEFVPTEEADIEQLAKAQGKTVEQIKAIIASLHEFNPMMGHRGCRLSVTFPEIAAMQTRAVIRAAINVQKKHPDWNLVPEIMIPLIGDAKELAYVKAIVTKTANEEMEKAGFKLDYKVGTMIEIPRAALTADEIAKEAEFFSFGTNDLTQMTFGFSRDDAGKFLNAYYDKKIYENDPFAKLDQKGVGKLVKMAAKMGRETRFDIHMGICGEHGGDPSSIEFCHKVGLDYVSCSPFRVPIARLAAAQAAIKENK